MRQLVLAIIALALLTAAACNGRCPPGHDPNGPGNSENAPGHTKKGR